MKIRFFLNKQNLLFCVIEIFYEHTSKMLLRKKLFTETKIEKHLVF